MRNVCNIWIDNCFCYNLRPDRTQYVSRVKRWAKQTLENLKSKRQVGVRCYWAQFDPIVTVGDDLKRRHRLYPCRDVSTRKCSNILYRKLGWCSKKWALYIKLIGHDRVKGRTQSPQSTTHWLPNETTMWKHGSNGKGAGKETTRALKRSPTSGRSRCSSV